MWSFSSTASTTTKTTKSTLENVYHVLTAVGPFINHSINNHTIYICIIIIIGQSSKFLQDFSKDFSKIKF